MRPSEIHYVLKNGEHSIEIDNLATAKGYYKRFLKLFPTLDKSNIRLFKVNVFEIELPKIEDND